MSSKLDYLKSYYDDDNDVVGETSSDRKRKKKHKKKKKRDGRSRTDAIVFKDEDEATNNDSFGESRALNSFSIKRDDDEDGENDDDGPTIVKSDELPQFTSEVSERLSTRSSRYDSKDSAGGDNITSRQHGRSSESKPSGERRQRYDSDDEPKKRRRYDSDESEQNPHWTVNVRHPSRYDSDSDRDNDDHNKSINGSQRYDSSDEEVETQRMSSGHKAGLQTGSDFSREEKKLQTERSEKSQKMVDRYGMGETVHRNISKTAAGANVAKKRILNENEQFTLNTGVVQIEKVEKARQDFEKIRESAFARSKDDEAMNDQQRGIVRDGDPMAARAAKKVSKQLQRSLYKGPAFKPNRFNIRPGFRWDGNDRGNGFEDRLLAKQANDKERQEESYRWSASGM